MRAIRQRKPAVYLNSTFAGLLLLSMGAGSEPAEAASAPAPSSAQTAPSSARDVSTFPMGTVVASYGDAVLAEYNTQSGPLRLLFLTGSPSEMGYQYGRLVGNNIPATWDALMSYLGSQMGVSATVAERKLGPMLDRAYSHMEPFVMGDYKTEMDGLLSGATDAGRYYRSEGGTDLRTMVKRLIALSDISDLSSSLDVYKLLVTGTSDGMDAFYQGQRSSEPSGAAARGSSGGTSAAATSSSMMGRTGSFFASWGERSQGGKLLASRNLDWAADTALRNQALITVYAPSTGYRYATFGYAGFIGAFAGMNEKGVVVSEVTAQSSLEKLKGQPWILRLREVLNKSSSVDQALPFMVNEEQADKVNRPTTIGHNFMVAQGDPSGAGLNSRVALFESNGGQTLVYDYSNGANGCKESARLYTYGRDGRISRTDTSSTSSLVNPENGAFEVDASAKGRRFMTVDGQFVRDAQGYYIEDPYAGSLMYVGLGMSCATFRGEEVMSHAIRRYQLAANGPQGTDPRLVMSDSDSYVDRYGVMSGLLSAFATGSSYTDQDGTIWYSGQGVEQKVGMDEAELVTRAAALNTNVMNVVYNGTDLTVRLSLDSEMNGVWTPASEGQYADILLHELFVW